MTMDMFCLIIWIIQLIDGTVKVFKDEKVNPCVFICAVLICILHYVERIW